MSKLENETSSLISLLELRAKAEVIEGQRCFVLDQKDFYEAAELEHSGFEATQSNSRIVAAGYDNFPFSLSDVDTHRYFICCKLGPVLDTLWSVKAQAESKGEPS